MIKNTNQLRITLMISLIMLLEFSCSSIKDEQQLLPPIKYREAFKAMFPIKKMKYRISLKNSSVKLPSKLRVYKTKNQSYSEAYVKDVLEKIFEGKKYQKVSQIENLSKYESSVGVVLFSSDDGSIIYETPNRYLESIGKKDVIFKEKWKKRIPERKLIRIASKWVMERGFDICDYSPHLGSVREAEEDVGQGPSNYYYRYTISMQPIVGGYPINGNTARLEVEISADLEVVGVFYRFLIWEKAEEYSTCPLDLALDFINSGAIIIPEEYVEGVCKFQRIIYYASDYPQEFLQPMYEFLIKSNGRSISVLVPAIHPKYYTNGVPLIDKIQY